MKLGGCLYAQMGVTSNGCLCRVDLLHFLNSLIIVLIACTMEGWWVWIIGRWRGGGCGLYEDGEVVGVDYRKVVRWWVWIKGR